MQTQCSGQAYLFPAENSRSIVATFDGGSITSDAGGLLLRQVERATGIIRSFSRCFVDHRDGDLIEHTVEELAAQRVYGLALGYEDLNDHDDLRQDPLLAVLVGKREPTGRDRLRARDRGKALAGKSTLNRLELTPVGADADSRYKKIVLNAHQAEMAFTEIFVQAHSQPPKRIVLDLDATDDPSHGNQLGRFFHGYYKNYCYLPLYIFCGEHLLWAQLRPADIDASAGSVRALSKIVERIRQSWPKGTILIRGDSGFCRENLMGWCESQGIDYVFGLARNDRLVNEIADELAQAKTMHQQTQQASRVFKDFEYQTWTSWSRTRRVVGKAEYLSKGENPRFVVTSLPKEEIDARTLYEETYCARGEMENRIKEQQLFLFADRTSAATMRANQLRLWFSSLAYTLLAALRRLGLQGTELAHAQCSTIRLKLLKIGAAIKITVRKVWLSLAESDPYRRIFQQVYDNLIRLTPLPLRC